MITFDSLPETQLHNIAVACQKNGVKRLELFGSRARQDFTTRSDFDFLVEFEDPLLPGLFDRFLILRESLEAIVGGEIDLVESTSIENPFLRRQIDSDRRLIYAA